MHFSTSTACILGNAVTLNYVRESAAPNYPLIHDVSTQYIRRDMAQHTTKHGSALNCQFNMNHIKLELYLNTSARASQLPSCIRVLQHPKCTWLTIIIGSSLFSHCKPTQLVNQVQLHIDPKSPASNDIFDSLFSIFTPTKLQWPFNAAAKPCVSKARTMLLKLPCNIASLLFYRTIRTLSKHCGTTSRVFQRFVGGWLKKKRKRLG